jgi:signal transduction histidine kinase
MRARVLAFAALRRGFARSSLVAATFACTALLFWTAFASAAEPRRVLIVHAFGHAYSPWSDMAAGFRAELIKATKEPIDLYEVSLDTARAQSQQDETPFVDYIHALLGGRKLDLIVPIGAPSAFFMQRNRERLFPATPMLIVGADRRRIPDYSLMENDATVLLNLDLPAYLANILQLRPETTEVAVVVGNSPVERYWTSELRRDFQPLADQVKIEWFNDLTFDEMLKRAAAMPPTATIFWFLLSEDAAGVPYSQDSALEAMRQIASVPMFGMGDFEMGRGIVGGPLMQIRKLGVEGANVALRILQGEKPSAIKTPDVLFGPPVFDWRELRHWNISEARLPRDSVVQFREPNVWERYRWQIVALATVLIAQAVVIAGLVVERRRRRIAEAMERQRLMEVMHLNRSAMAGALSTSIAHELGQPLGAIRNNAEAALLYLKQSPPNLAKVGGVLTRIVQDNDRAANIITHLRRMLKKRGEAETQEVDLNDVISGTMDVVRSEALKNGVDLASYKPNGALPVRVDPVQLQQVLVNLTMNGIDAMRDCEKRAMSISSALIDGSSVEVSVSDTGTGIPTGKLNEVFEAFYTTKGHGTGLGLSIARTIIETFGGKMWAENRPVGGALFRFTLPLAKTAETQ